MRLNPTTPDDSDPRWVRFESILGRVRPGQTVTIGALASRTGLAIESVGTVLQALTRAEIFVHLGGATFRRGSLLDRALEKIGWDGDARPASNPDRG